MAVSPRMRARILQAGSWTWIAWSPSPSGATPLRLLLTSAPVHHHHRNAWHQSVWVSPLLAVCLLRLAAPEPVPCLARCLRAGHRRTEAHLWFVPAVTPDNPRCNSPPRATSWPRTAAASSGEGSLTKGRKESFSTTRRHLKKPGKASHHDSQAFYAKRACLQAFPHRDAVTISLV
ncbi:hypothetical protein B0T11DRAFT_276522 [Plectosphaerella cucumerina]|uniref:Uncharacterized protein n=1 Tax=Plectosphaerella cucumerina TaxID=40658 RepID=A0A8K0X721_9PEZI|nr:hypothetical protein B0T11DRAFT_276522 [Plectosphaerella cucumerina]